MSSKYGLPLFLLFLGGLMIAVSAPIRGSHTVLSSTLFYCGYIVDAIAIFLFFKIRFQKS